eukprot:2470475-Prymnesium_polylepis.2
MPKLAGAECTPPRHAATPPRRHAAACAPHPHRTASTLWRLLRAAPLSRAELSIGVFAVHLDTSAPSQTWRCPCRRGSGRTCSTR